MTCRKSAENCCTASSPLVPCPQIHIHIGDDPDHFTGPDIPCTCTRQESNTSAPNNSKKLGVDLFLLAFPLKFSSIFLVDPGSFQYFKSLQANERSLLPLPAAPFW